MYSMIHPYSILFIEDEDNIRKNYVEYLKKYYRNVFEAKDGVKAYEIYKLEKPDILIVDINIPKLNGIDLLQKIRVNDHYTKAIMLTAHSDSTHLLKATELKLTKYLIKPISRLELKEALNLAHNELYNYKIIVTNNIQINEKYKWDSDSLELLDNSIVVELTPQERKFLELFFNNINKLLTYEVIIDFIWINTYDNKVDALKTLVKKLRKKIPEVRIKNIYGIGYKLVI
ncbi:MAG: response regulator transcription factor [Aliarcobacter sp.]|nr:response regulator transcription factor [Aliarcobacter sp.]